MPTRIFSRRSLTLLTITICALIATFLLFQLFRDVLGPRIFGIITSDSQDVDVRGFIRTKKINFKVYPEKRVPVNNNWSTVADIVLENCSTAATYEFTGIITNNMGEGTLEIPNEMVILDGNYSFKIKGFSHLRRLYGCYTINQVEASIDLTTDDIKLLAGELSLDDDNYLNALDISVLLHKLYSNDTKSDLNQDGKVNSLDFSNQIYNLYVAGD